MKKIFMLLSIIIVCILLPDFVALADNYKPPIPLLPDPDFAIHKAYGKIKVPYFLVERIKDDGTQRVVCCTYAFTDGNDFLKLILKKSELTK